MPHESVGTVFWVLLEPFNVRLIPFPEKFIIFINLGLNCFKLMPKVMIVSDFIGVFSSVQVLLL